MTNNPETFSEKLDLLADLFAKGEDLRLPETEITQAEERLNTRFPEALKSFYLRFGKGGTLFSKCQNTIFTPKELLNYTVEEEDEDENADLSPEELLAKGGDLVLVRENQGVWQCRLDQRTGVPYLDMGDGEREVLNMNLEEALLWFLAINITTNEAYAGGLCENVDLECAQEKLGRDFVPLVEGENRVFVLPERNIIGVRCDADGIWIGALDDEALEALEEDTGIEVSWW